jgi:hypothetical protein
MGKNSIDPSSKSIPVDKEKIYDEIKAKKTED